MGGEWLDSLLQGELDRREQAHNLRSRHSFTFIDATHLQSEGRSFVNFASNDYLGLSHHPQIVAAARKALSEAGLGAGASPLVTGYSAFHQSAERAIAQWKQTESAVLLPSGYQTAHAIVQTLAGIGQFRADGVRFLLDKLVHASIIDAVAASGRPFRIFPHNQFAKLDRLLAEVADDQLQVVITEAIFSMDGDSAGLHDLVQLKRKHRFVLVLDEAHASGVYGAGGAGLACEWGLQSSVDVSLVTFSKAMGISGGAACGSRAFCEALVNWGRAYIYSTAVPIPIAAAIPAAIDVLKHEPQRQQRLRSVAQRVRKELFMAGLRIPPGDSPIIPVILGQERLALQGAQCLREQGLLVAAIRPPTVPKGASRLRVTLSSEHTDEDLRQLVDALKRLVEVKTA